MNDIEYDLGDLMSPRDQIEVIETNQIVTKSQLNFDLRDKEAENLSLLISNKKLTIICADDAYFNLEALRIIF